MTGIFTNRGQLAAVGVVDVDHAEAGELRGEQARLGGEVVVEVLVEVEVVLRQVGEDRDVVEQALDAAQRQRVAGDLHRRGGHLLLAHQREQALQVAGLGGGQLGVITTSPAWISTPPTRPVRWPAARSPASSRNVEVDLPLVPVTPMTGMSAARLAVDPGGDLAEHRARVGQHEHQETGRGGHSAPSWSVRIALAPAPMAAELKVAPWAVLPWIAT